MIDAHAGWMRKMFDSASRKYGSLNSIMTAGMDEIWRKRVVQAIAPKAGLKVLDICTGPGDLALKIARRFPDGEVHALDFSAKMLFIARARASALKCDNLTFTEGDCTEMPYKSGYFDCVTVSFGFRNLSYSADTLDRALKEIYRVLKSGGLFIIVETSQPPNALVRGIFHFYASRVVPFAGAVFSGEKDAYTYLGKSMVKFFAKSELTRLLGGAHFAEKESVPFFSGAILLSVFAKERYAGDPAAAA